MAELKIGDKAPDFSLPGSDGKTISLGDYRGKNVVLYFYPKDDTPGCTKEAIAFTAYKDKFAAANTEIIGMSKDSAAKHDKFRAKHDLTIDLAADESGDILECYGVWKEKSMYGRTFMGVERSTFLIDGDGIIRHIWRKVKVKEHAEDVLARAASL